MGERKIFKTLISPEEALKRLEAHCKIAPLGVETVPLLEAYGRVVAEDVFSNVDVPGFDKAAMDGYAVKAADTFDAREDQPIRLRVTGVSQPGAPPKGEVKRGEAVEIGTGAPIPRGANAVVMVEYTQTVDGGELSAYRAVSPGENITSAGSDLMIGELVLRRGQKVTPREIGLLAAVGVGEVKVYRKPRVAVISTGNELVAPGRSLDYAKIYDVNSSSISASVMENGGAPLKQVIVRDDPVSIQQILVDAVKEADIILTSGSTSAGAGDIIYNVLDELGPPGILAHGLTVKPGKPTIVAVVRGRPVIGLPGYPTSALMIFNLVVVSIIRRMAGLPEGGEHPPLEAKAAVKIFSVKGRRELLPVQVVSSKRGRLVYPVGGGSGAISSMALADGYIDIPKNQEFIEEGEGVKVRLFSSELHPSDIIIMGSHCTGVDLLLQHMRSSAPNLSFKVVNTGSVGGFQAVERGEADVAGVHLLDEETGEYNAPFLERFNLTGRAHLVRGYRREQGLIVAKRNPKNIRRFEDILRQDVSFINRNPGSGTRLLTDSMLNSVAEKKKVSFDELKKGIAGYDVEAKSHSAVAAAVAQERVDVGVGIKTVAHFYHLGFIPVADEMYDFLIPADRVEKESVKILLETLKSKKFHKDLGVKMPGLNATSETGVFLDAR